MPYSPSGNFHIKVEDALKAARDAGAESMMFYSQDHWGYRSTRPKWASVTRISKVIFSAKKWRSARQTGDVGGLLLRLQFNNQCVLKHPDWGWANENAEQQRMRWYITCLDSPYRQYVFSMMHEILSRYEVDELFLDIFGIQFHTYHERSGSVLLLQTHPAGLEREHPGRPLPR